MKFITAPVLASLLALTACGGGDPSSGVDGMATGKSLQVDEVIKNADFTSVITDNLGRVKPTDWNCPNYPIYNSTTCRAEAGAVTIYSTWVGRTITERRSRPVNPTWNQTINVPSAGSYTLTIKVTKKTPSTGSTAVNTLNESPYQAVVLKSGLTPIATIPHAELAADQEVTRTFVVALSAGTNYLYLGTAVRPMYPNNGYFYRFSLVSLTPL